MANYENAKDLKEEVLRHSGELTDGTSEYDETVMIFLNRAYLAILSGAADLGLDIGQPWAWAKKRHASTMVIQPMVRAYTTTATFNSDAITFNTVIPYSVKNYYISFDDHADVYRVASHVAGTAVATLDSVYIGDSGAAFGTRLMKLDYQLDPGILRLVGPMSTSRNSDVNWDGKIEMIDQSTFNRDYPMGVREGCPDRFTQVFKDNGMRPTVRFNRIPASGEKPIRIEYDSIPVPESLTDDEASIPVVPRDHRATLDYYATYYLLMDKNDSRAAEYRELARAGMMALVRASKVEKANTNSNYGRLISRSDQGGVNRGRVWRGYF